MEVQFKPLTVERWPDLETLFGPRGATGGCWCMYWRLKRSVFEQQKGAGNKEAFRHIVEQNEPPGILAYMANQPVGWCAVGPRESYPVLAGSRNLKRVDEQPVWSIVCFFMAKAYRGRGLTVEMIRAAVAFAGERAAKIVEAYPIEPKAEQMPAVFAWAGFASAFRQAGFVEVLRRAETRPIFRYVLGNE
jgi:RimJ/RimL family protein N-acetyltransferase